MPVVAAGWRGERGAGGEGRGMQCIEPGEPWYSGSPGHRTSANIMTHCHAATIVFDQLSCYHYDPLRFVFI